MTLSFPLSRDVIAAGEGRKAAHVGEDGVERAGAQRLHRAWAGRSLVGSLRGRGRA